MVGVWLGCEFLNMRSKGRRWEVYTFSFVMLCAGEGENKGAGESLDGAGTLCSSYRRCAYARTASLPSVENSSLKSSGSSIGASLVWGVGFLLGFFGDGEK